MAAVVLVPFITGTQSAEALRANNVECHMSHHTTNRMSRVDTFLYSTVLYIHELQYSVRVGVSIQYL
jgi:hypothetical protein